MYPIDGTRSVENDHSLQGKGDFLTQRFGMNGDGFESERS